MNEMMQTTTIVKNERPDSIELNTNSKGEIQWSVKVYGDTCVNLGIEDMKTRLAALKGMAQELARKDRTPDDLLREGKV